MLNRFLVTLWLLLSLAVPAQAQLSTGLVSYWSLEEASGTRVDDHGSNDLTDNNTVTSDTGKIGDAAEFVAANAEFLSRASNSTLEMGDVDFSICAWIYRTDGIDRMIVAKDDDAGSARDYTLDIVSAKARFYINGGGGGVAESTIGMSEDTWYFVCGGHSAADNVMWVSVDNETPVTTGTGGTAPDVSSAIFMIGAREYPANEGYFDGLLDEVGLWERDVRADLDDLFDGGAGCDYTCITGGGGGPTPAPNLGLLGVGN